MSRTVEIYVDLVTADTDSAFQFRIDGIDYWVPKSLIDLDESEATEKGMSGFVYIQEWKAIELELV